MTINDAITRIKVPLANGIPSDDFPYSDEHIYSMLQTMRSKRLRQKMDQDAFISQFSYSVIDCVPLEWGKYSDCPCYTSDCFILRSKYKIPSFISNRTGLPIIVTTLNGNIISEGSITKEQFNNYKRSKVKTLNYFIHNDYLYITGSNQLKVVSIKGILNDPLELKDIPICDTEGNSLGVCHDPLNEKYPIDMELFEDIETMILEKAFKYRQYGIKDEENNDSEDVMYSRQSE